MGFYMHQIWSHRRAGVDEKGVRTFSDSYRIISDDPADGPGQARDQAAFIIGDTYNSGNDADDYATIRNIEANQTHWLFDISVFEIVIEYSTQQEPPDQQNQDNPEDTPTQITGGTLIVREAYDVDVNGKPSINSAGLPIVPKPERDRCLSTMTITRNEKEFDRTAVIRDYAERWNTDTFDGHLPGTALIKSITYTRTFAANEPFYRVTYEIIFKDDVDKDDVVIGWKRQRLLNQGRKQLYAMTLIDCVDSLGQPAVDDFPLDANGKQLALPVDSTKITYTDLQPYFSAAFGPLNLLGNLP